MRLLPCLPPSSLELVQFLAEKRALDDTGALLKVAEPTGLESSHFAASVPFW
jgi:hypothetical protein